MMLRFQLRIRSSWCSLGDRLEQVGSVTIEPFEHRQHQILSPKQAPSQLAQVTLEACGLAGLRRAWSLEC